jgi:hypothetical protein
MIVSVYVSRLLARHSKIATALLSTHLSLHDNKRFAKYPPLTNI